MKDSDIAYLSGILVQPEKLFTIVKQRYCDDIITIPLFVRESIKLDKCFFRGFNMKKLLSLLLSGYIVLLSYSGIIPISINATDTSDGVIDLTDLSFLSLYLLRDKEFTDNQLKAADVDGDGDVHLTDLARMRQYISNCIDSF